MLDIKALADGLLQDVRSFMERSIAGITGRVEALEKTDHATVIQALLLPAVEKAVAAIPPAAPGAPGHTPTPEELQALIEPALTKAVAALPPPAAGHTPTPEELQALIEPALTKAVAAIPPAAPGAPGRTPTPEELQALLLPAVEKAVAAIPPAAPGAPGRTPTPEELGALVLPAVEKAVAALPPPAAGEPGHTPTPEELQALLLPAVEKAVAAKSLTPDDVQPMLLGLVEAAVSALPPAAAGHTPTPEELTQIVERAVAATELMPLVAQAVKDAIGAIPSPDLAPLVEQAVAKAMAGVRRPEDGRDALHLEILPEINIERAFPRGTYAKHKGGLWRSFETTLGLKGWECIVSGVAEMGVEQTDERNFAVTFSMSDGSQNIKSFSMPVMIDRGVYRETEVYEKGDTVTWAGSAWICQEKTIAKPDSGNGDWRLAVKRGRDGKPAEGVKL